MEPNRSTTVLVVDDEAPMRRLLSDLLTPEGFRVVEASTGEEMMEALDRHPIDLVTLDLNLAGEDGLRLARTVRAHRNVPIIMITGKADPIDRIVGLELGADDYVTKPFHLREVLARIRAVLRRYEPSVLAPAQQSTRLAFDGHIVDPGRREVVGPSGAPVDLTTTEFDLLSVFLRAPGRVLSRDQIMDQLKGHDWSPFDRSIDAMVARLRRKIEPQNEVPRLIKTVRGVGYVFAVTVTSAPV